MLCHDTSNLHYYLNKQDRNDGAMMFMYSYEYVNIENMHSLSLIDV
jgi:hypothetical protein